MAEAQLTPMMAQYRRIKSELPKDALLLFRLGDFYEMFFEDAELGAQLADPIRPEIQEDLAQHNGVFLKASEFESHADFSQPL